MPFTVFKRDIFLFVRPRGLPSTPSQELDKFFSGCRSLFCIQDGSGAIHEITLPGLSVIMQHGLIFVFLPADHFFRFDPAAVKMLSFFCDGKTSLPTELIRKILLPREIPFCLMELMSVEKGNGVCHDVAVEMFLVLVNGNHTLKTGEEFFCESFSDFQNFRRCDFLFSVKGNDVVRIHSAGVFLPQTFFFQP